MPVQDVRNLDMYLASNNTFWYLSYRSVLDLRGQSCQSIACCWSGHIDPILQQQSLLRRWMKPIHYNPGKLAFDDSTAR